MNEPDSIRTPQDRGIIINIERDHSKPKRVITIWEGERETQEIPANLLDRFKGDFEIGDRFAADVTRTTGVGTIEEIGEVTKLPRGYSTPDATIEDVIRFREQGRKWSGPLNWKHKRRGSSIDPTKPPER